MMNMYIKNFMIILFMISLTFFTAEANAAVNCKKHPIYCHIKKVKPKMNSVKAMKISNIFYEYSKKYRIKKPTISVAIATQETSFNPRLSRRQNVIVFNDKMTEWKIVRGYTDICMFQFHVDTIVNEKLDPIKLKLNLDYCIEQHFKLMAKKLRICKRLGSEAWTCYHSKTKKLRKRYKEDVERYL